MSSKLHDFQVGESTLVIAVNLEEKERLRLESMGIMPGVEISILARGVGPLIVTVGEARVMVEQEIAEGIIVV
ncbi:ferrous iron transport protein A [Deltaproteobacteria bacterium OttesenSCG-928-K17]|nr:ferrous iron transport protein A [Deltaproteobacteria bacterium OttesenSCG-928-K17]